MLYVLYRNTGVHSGRALRKTLSAMMDGEVKGGYPKRLTGLMKVGKTPSTIVNLGVTDLIGYKGRILNTPDMVRSTSHKKKAREVFKSKDVPAPELFLNWRDVKKEDLPIVARTSYHKKGQGFWFCKTLTDVRNASDQGATHFLAFIPITREYRVHTFIKAKHLTLPIEERESKHYVSIKISEKVWQGKGKPNVNTPQKNHEFGWTFLGQQNRREEELDVVRHAAKQAIASLGIDFGAVDIMYEIRSKKPYVLEVNSTPSLSDDNANTCEVYAERIKKTMAKIEGS